MNTIQSLHRTWAERVMPVGASKVQRQEMERAFFSGASAAFGLMVAEIAELPDADADKAMDRLRSELTDYFKLLMTIPGTEGVDRQ